jgi:hypothetical protein
VLQDALTVSKAIRWDEVVIVEGGKGAGNNAKCLLVGVGLLAHMVETQAPKAVLSSPLVALQCMQKQCLSLTSFSFSPRQVC